MPVIKKEKSNADHLRSILNTAQEEGLEFIEALEKQIEEKDERIAELLEDVDAPEEEDDEPEYANEINAGIGYIRWDSNNIQLSAIMEAIEEKLKTCSPNSIVDHINAMKS